MEEVSLVGDTSVVVEVVGMGWVVSAGVVHALVVVVACALVVVVVCAGELVVVVVCAGELVVVVAATAVVEASVVLPHPLHPSLRFLSPPRGLALVNAKEATTTASVLSCIVLFRAGKWIHVFPARTLVPDR